MQRILRQVVDVDVHGSEAYGRELQRQVCDLCRDTVGARLERVLAAFDTEDRFVVIDRLDVDLGVVAGSDIEAALTRSLPAALSSSLRERGLEAREQPLRSAGVQLLAPEEALQVAVLEFLRHGRLPWWYDASGRPALETQWMAQLAPIAGDAWQPGLPADRSRRGAWIDALARTLKSDGRARLRLVRQFSPTTAFTVLKLIDARRHARWLDAWRHAGPAPGGVPSDEPRRALVEQAFESLESSAACATPLAEPPRQNRSRPARSSSNRTGRRVERGGQVDARPEGRPEPALQSVEDAEVVGGGLPVENAGLVLLHPFLARFLEALEVAREGMLLRPSRAALLLHHLAMGALEAQEHELVLIKVLCGLSIEEVLQREAPVSPEEQAEATALLESAVRHWDALRSTTPDGLRGNFLARRGRLEIQEGDWVLHVESQSFDHLLDSLPWGIAHVKLPWMRRLMHVGWSP